jgi:Zn-dependent protease
LTLNVTPTVARTPQLLKAINGINYSWRIGNIFGVPTDLHWTFVFVPTIILYFAYIPGYGMNWQAAGWWSTIALLLFTFILIHELGHALVARDRGVKAERIILFPLGGGAYLPDQPKQLWAEVLVYAAGPLANIFVAIVAWIALLLRPDGELLIAYFLRLSGNIVVQPGILDQILGITLGVNLLLAAGNLLPAYPLDGGRILRALLRGPLGARKSTIVVTTLGLLFGLPLIWLGVELGDPLLACGAVFIILLSGMEYRNGWQRRRLAKTSSKLVLRVPGDTDLRVYMNETVGAVRQRFTASGWPVLPVFNQWNEQIGFVDTAVLEEESSSDEESVAPYCEAEFITAPPEEDLLSVTERIVAANVYGATVLGKRGKLVGYVFTNDVMEVLDNKYRRAWRQLTR